VEEVCAAVSSSTAAQRLSADAPAFCDRPAADRLGRVWPAIGIRSLIASPCKEA
jgi:hypothetical protein